MSGQTPQAWYARLLEHVDPSDRIGELLFGLIMVLTFTLGAGIQLGGDADASRELLLAALGCNAAWGIIDAALYVIDRLAERGRIHRLIRLIQTTPDEADALALVDGELADRLPAVVRQEIRALLGREVLERLRSLPPSSNRVRAADLWAAFMVFCLVFFTALPAVLPFLVMNDAQLAMRASNGVLIGLLFFAGWRWGTYVGARPWATGLFMMLLGVGLVLVAIRLGG